MAIISNNTKHVLKHLNEDDKNVSDQAVQEALTTVNADNVKITASELQLKNQQSSVKLQWGDALAKLAYENQLEPRLANLLNRKNVLIQISLRQCSYAQRRLYYLFSAGK